MSFEDNVEKLRVRFVSILKWIGIDSSVDKESLQTLVQKCRERRSYSGNFDELIYLLSRAAENLSSVSSGKDNVAYSDLINKLGEIEGMLKILPPQDLDNICVVMR